MHAVFLEVDTERDWAVASLGPAFIASYLRTNGHSASFYRIRLDTSKDQYLQELAKLNAGMFAFSLMSRQWLRAKNIAKTLKATFPTTPIIAGGLHPTFSPEAVLDFGAFDYVCLGEGEQAMCELLSHLQSGSTPNKIQNIMCQGDTERPTLRAAFEPIDALPHMARDFLDERHGCIHVSTQRGCPFPCTYCAARTYDDLYQNTSSYGRRRSINNVLDELRQIQQHASLNYVIFLDDTFTIHHPWVQQFCQQYREEFKVPFSLHARVETVSEGLLEMLANAGCKHITYGVESGSERVRLEIMKRPVKNERFEKVFKWTQDVGIMVTANYMLGLPGETEADIQQTLDLAQSLPVTDFGYFIFYPYPGTALFKLCLERGYLPSNYLDLEANHRQSILKLPDLSRGTIEDYYLKFTDLRAATYQSRAQHPINTTHVYESARKG